MLTRVRRARLERGLPQKKVSNMLEVSAQALSRVEGGQLMPWPRLRKQLANLYSVPEHELFEDIDAAQRFLREKAGEKAHEPEAA